MKHVKRYKIYATALSVITPLVYAVRGKVMFSAPYVCPRGARVQEGLGPLPRPAMDIRNGFRAAVHLRMKGFLVKKETGSFVQNN